MNRVLIELTARQLLGRRRVILIALLALIPVAVAVIYRVGDGPADTDPDEFLSGLMQGFVIPVILPIAALVFGTGALGAEIEDGTVVYLLTKPIRRWRIVAAKLLVAATATIALVVPAVVVSALIVMGGEADHGLTLGFAGGAAAGAVAYCTVFLALSAVTGRALIIGMAYVFIWEGTITSFLSGTRVLAIRHYVLSFADALSSAPARVFDAPLGTPEAIFAIVVIVVAAFAVAVHRLERFELGERA